MMGLEPTTFCMANARDRSHPFASVRSNHLFAATTGRASEPQRTRANAECSHCSHCDRCHVRLAWPVALPRTSDAADFRLGRWSVFRRPKISCKSARPNLRTLRHASPSAPAVTAVRAAHMQTYYAPCCKRNDASHGRYETRGACSGGSRGSPGVCADAAPTKQAGTGLSVRRV